MKSIFRQVRHEKNQLEYAKDKIGDAYVRKAQLSSWSINMNKRNKLEFLRLKKAEATCISTLDNKMSLSESIEKWFDGKTPESKQLDLECSSLQIEIAEMLAELDSRREQCDIMAEPSVALNQEVPRVEGNTTDEEL
jgi:hypothetical protein